MLEAARQNKVKTFVYASNSSVYGDETHLPKQERGRQYDFARGLNEAIEWYKNNL